MGHSRNYVLEAGAEGAWGSGTLSRAKPQAPASPTSSQPPGPLLCQLCPAKSYLVSFPRKVSIFQQFFYNYKYFKKKVFEHLSRSHLF